MSKIKKNRFVAIVAALAIVTMFTMSIQYSLNGYGIKNMVSLHPEVWAQTNGTGTGGGGSSTGGGSGSESGGSGSGSGSGSESGGSGSGSESGNEGGSGTTGPLWDRKDEACEYNFTGEANATITIAGVITIKLNGKGEATYSVKDGKTNCASGGNEQCTARYCPIVPGCPN